MDVLKVDFFYSDNVFGCDYEVCINYQMNYKVVRTFLHCLANRFVSAVKQLEQTSNVESVLSLQGCMNYLNQAIPQDP